MDRKGFTLIELLAVIVLIGVLGVLIVPGLLNNVNDAKEASYNTLIKNIITSSEMYYEECEYGDLSDTEKYKSYACKIENNSITTTLGTLTNTGFLKTNNIDEETKLKKVINPINDKDISDCKINIIKKVNPSTYKVTYQIVNADTNEICPNTYE